MYLETEWCRYEDKNKLLYLTIPWTKRELRVHSWQNGCILEKKLVIGAWCYDDTDVPIANELFTGGDATHPFSKYASTLPPEVVCNVSHYCTEQLAMLQLCAATDRAIQLLYSNPNLLWLIAPYFSKFVKDKLLLHSFFGMKRHELLGRALGRAEPLTCPPKIGPP